MSYDPTLHGEQQRLSAQARLLHRIDRRLVNKALLQLPPEYEQPHIPVIDLGCGYGHVTKSVFNNPRFEPVIGIDKNIRTEDPAIRFEQIDLQSADTAAQLKRLNIKKPALIYSSLLLHHLNDPVKLLRDVHDAFPNGSRIVIRTVEDEHIAAHPDHGLKRLLQLSRQGADSDRSHGVHLLNQLQEAHYIDIQLSVETMLLSNMDNQSRSDAFETCISYRSRFGEEAERLVQQLREPFADPTFFFSVGWVCAIASILKKDATATISKR